eukprot:g11928.t1
MQLVDGKFERLARRVALSGFLSRTEAEKAIRSGEVLVDGRFVRENCVVPDSARVTLVPTTSAVSDAVPPPAATTELTPDLDSMIDIPAQDGLPKLWALRKPPHVVCNFGPLGNKRSRILDWLGPESSSSSTSASPTKEDRHQQGEQGSERRDSTVAENAANGDDNESTEGTSASSRRFAKGRNPDDHMRSTGGRSDDDRANLRDLFDNFRKYDVRRYGEQSMRLEQSDDRLLAGFHVVNPLKFGHEGLLLLTNCGRFKEKLRAAPIEVIYDIRLQTTVDENYGRGVNKYKRNKDKVDIARFPEIVHAWRQGVSVRGVDYGKVYGNLVRRNPDGGSTWLRIRMVEQAVEQREAVEVRQEDLGDLPDHSHPRRDDSASTRGTEIGVGAVPVSVPPSSTKSTTTTRTRFLDPELLIWEHLKVRSSVIRRAAWGKIRMTAVPDLTIMPISFAEHAWLTPFIPQREDRRELVVAAGAMGNTG